MSATRIIGQDVEVMIVNNGQPLQTLSAIRSLSIEFGFNVAVEGYLGESTNRRDEVFTGVTGTLELHMDNDDAIDFVQALVERARTRLAGNVVNIKAALNWPNGDRKRIIIRDASFGSVPLSFGSRQDPGTLTLNWEAADYTLF